MVENEIECFVFEIDIKNLLLKPWRQKRYDFAKTATLPKFWMIGIEMLQDSFRTFHAVIIALLLLLLNGCGYKADPYYPTKQETSK